ncbi:MULTISPECIES: helix-turn-helix domain-containing protein [Chromohalobacter]|uniref:Transcriptional regulator, XRE family n=1 Tax=Chromohalobacter israelensis (strain ATCC BAA-138 / DSM 3043 / CIP 106854 / NCIMB 13768 / 1H11) TaxID=290398 RepID=Q1QWA0_CHRI1|nr:XRE family transcriptional regulator [Chromohalobacter salexigens]ABE59258.1 transcriptional regulator, XRE family [Chromohalobacter salexigens DSM 3043]MDO0946598.1 XRE family transcriptional regulator [Chromohalobacter salexigens]NWO56660.1 XRE family transcriptional regulator [Chromohalobacter salexigens]PWW40648.1 XRE family transcriptional regulator [Chromohalobacter salexigens]RXE48352.1 transcriptional regulator [Chromohalobacter salexigens]
MATQTDSEAALRIASGRKAFVEPLRLGERLKEIRLSNRWTLEDVSQRTGLARSTLSKIENDQISPTFSAVQKLIGGLGIDLPQLLTPPKPQSRTLGRRDLTRVGEGKQHPTPTYEHELLSWQLAQKRMIPFKTIVRARDFNEFSEWVRHDGEEFLMVLDGDIWLYTEFYEPLHLAQGDSIYFDSDMGHALISVSETDAVVLSVCTRGENA